MRNPRWCASILALLLIGCSARGFVQGTVAGETGHEGAVRVVGETEEGGVGVLTVEIPYLDVRGKTKLGMGRLMVRAQELRSGRPIPVFCHVHYEKDIGGARKWCERGWAVATAHYDKEHPIDVSVGDGYNLAHALIQWVRRLPIIDPARLHIDGGSQGGYMALAMSADFFPVTSATADCPVVNWAYNLNYFEANRAVSRYPQQDIKDSPLPVVCAVTMLADWAYGVFGNDLGADTWYRLSPIAWVDRIANPVLIMCATGDMLVPMEQMMREGVHKWDKSLFPEGYQRDFDALTRCEKARKRFVECIPADQLDVRVMPLQKNSFEITLDMFTDAKKKPGRKPKNADRPWSPNRQWTICCLDEGPPAPQASHTRYEWATSPDSFVAAHQKSNLAPALLNGPKLEHLLRRYMGQLQDPPLLADGSPANRLNFAPLERLDVLTGLLTFAETNHACMERLAALYDASSLKPFGETIALDALRRLAQEARAALSNKQKGAI
ncbi:MAG TPA: hypothetical protein PK967_00430 [Candidatus Hydrogenedentes bacterium]|nr:hypothetical protein [Candidatus Hydrogenedentota bacterium]